LHFVEEEGLVIGTESLRVNMEVWRKVDYLKDVAGTFMVSEPLFTTKKLPTITFKRCEIHSSTDGYNF